MNNFRSSILLSIGTLAKLSNSLRAHVSMRAALVTGSNRGLGFLAAMQIAKVGGWHVVAGARDWRACGESAAVLKAAADGSGGRLTLLPLEVSDPASRAAAVATLKSVGTKLDVLLNNAGIYPQEWSADAYARAMAVNAIGPLHLAQEMQAAGLLAPGAHVVNVSSGLGKLEGLSPAYASAVTSAPSVEALAAIPFNAGDKVQAAAYAPAYRVAKAALNRGTQILAAAWAGPHGVRVNSVDPGWCRTDMGGAGAPRSGDDGADSLVQVALSTAPAAAPPATGQFFNSAGKPFAW